MKKNLLQGMALCTALAATTLIMGNAARAEGTKQLSPNTSNVSSLAVMPSSGNGPYLSTNPGVMEQRIRVRVADLDEKIYFGFRWYRYNENAVLDNVWMRIYAPDGTEVTAARHRFRSNATSQGSIPGTSFSAMYNSVVTGPNGVGGVTDGYIPYVFTPTELGEYSVVFYESGDGGNTMVSSNWMKSPFWDITVGNTSLPVSEQIQEGRVFSLNWSLVATASNFRTTAQATAAPVFYSYSHDQTLVKLGFALDSLGNGGLKPIAYNVGFTHHGIDETETDWGVNRASSIFPNNPGITGGYKVFLSEPSRDLYPIQEIGEEPKMASTPITGCSGDSLTAHFVLPAAGDARILFDIDGDGDGFTPGTRDFVLEAFDHPAGPGTIKWDGKDGMGNFLASGTQIKISATYQRGRFNLPIYDAEVNSLGMYIETIAPISSPSNRLYWDDSRMSPTGFIASPGTCTDAAINVTGIGWNNSFAGTLATASSPTRAWNGDGNPDNVVPAPSVTRGSGQNDANSQQCDDYGNVRVLNTWGWALEAESDFISFSFGCYDISGYVIHDADGIQDGLIDPSSDLLLPAVPLYAHLVNENNVVIAVVNVDGTTGGYNFTNIPAGTYQVVIAAAETGEDDVIVVPEAPIEGWVFAGEQLGIERHVNIDNTQDGVHHIVLNGHLENVNFAIQQPPVADPKDFIVEESAFSTTPPAGFNAVPEYKSILMSSGDLTGYTTGGSLSGSDPEDCVDQSSCHTGTGAVFVIESINESTKLYYDFGTPGTPDVQEIVPGVNSVIEDFNASKMVIYGKKDAGVGIDAIGFEYSMRDKAGFSSSPVRYTVETSSPLPVKWIYFTAEPDMNSAVLLKWGTAGEQNNKGFFIERSRDGKEWDTLNFILSQAEDGNSSGALSYSYSDDAPAAGTNFYRLRQSDRDGRYEYSDVRKVDFSTLKAITVMPNPTTGIVTLKGLSKGTHHLILTNAVGQVILENEIAGSGEYQMNLAGLVAGTYYISVRNEAGEMSHHKVVKQ